MEASSNGKEPLWLSLERDRFLDDCCKIWQVSQAESKVEPHAEDPFAIDDEIANIAENDAKGIWREPEPASETPAPAASSAHALGKAADEVAATKPSNVAAITAASKTGWVIRPLLFFAVAAICVVTPLGSLPMEPVARTAADLHDASLEQSPDTAPQPSNDIGSPGEGHSAALTPSGSNAVQWGGLSATPTEVTALFEEFRQHYLVPKASPLARMEEHSASSPPEQKSLAKSPVAGAGLTDRRRAMPGAHGHLTKRSSGTPVYYQRHPGSWRPEWRAPYPAQPQNSTLWFQNYTGGLW